MLDAGEADDKIIAVLENDPFWSEARDLADLPDVLVERLRHYFLTYKMVRGGDATVSIDDAYGQERALQVIEASIADYGEEFGTT